MRSAPTNISFGMLKRAVSFDPARAAMTAPWAFCALDRIQLVDGGTITEEMVAQGLINLSESSPKTYALALYSSICRDFLAVSTWQKTMIKLLGDLSRSKSEVVFLASLYFSSPTFASKPNLCAPERSYGW